MTSFSSTLNFSMPIIIISQKLIHFSPVSKKLSFSLFLTISSVFIRFMSFFIYFTCFFLPSVLTMMHLCVIQHTHWTPLHARFENRNAKRYDNVVVSKLSQGLTHNLL